jgi:hypothetical protein
LKFAVAALIALTALGCKQDSEAVAPVVVAVPVPTLEFACAKEVSALKSAKTPGRVIANGRAYWRWELDAADFDRAQDIIAKELSARELVTGQVIGCGPGDASSTTKSLKGGGSAVFAYNEDNYAITLSVPAIRPRSAPQPAEGW